MSKRILLVNEDPAVRRMLFRVLTGEGHQVVLASPERESLRSVLRGDLDVVLLDSDLTSESAVDLLERLGPPDHLPPTILLSDRAERKQWGGLNILAVMEKPLDLPRLLQIISKLPAGAAGAPQQDRQGFASAA
jgi:DNA-binding response OmpR family regulator